MNYFIRNIHINKLFHLENFDIPIANEKCPHLIITGKNGSGKTVLLNAIVDFIEIVKKDFEIDEYEQGVGQRIQEARDAMDNLQIEDIFAHIHSLRKNQELLYKKVGVSFDNQTIIESFKEEDFIIAFYRADRSIKMIESESPQKAQVNTNDIRKTSSDQFINFLVDLKFQELLSLSNNEQEKANNIKMWFKNFENLLKEIFEDENLSFRFDQEEKNYSFKISTEGQIFGFNEMSDGFKAVIHIVADLILKMQNGGKISDVYQKEGLVLIDEIETHLHLELQKIVMPLLTKVFPNIQFIITTHSPFVLNSMENAVAFDLEHRKPIEDLSNYSYEALAEGYFGVSTESSTVELRLRRLQELLGQKERSDSDKNEMRLLITELDKVSEAVSPDLVGEYISLKLNNVNVIKEIVK